MFATIVRPLFMWRAIINRCVTDCREGMAQKERLTESQTTDDGFKDDRAE